MMGEGGGVNYVANDHLFRPRPPFSLLSFLCSFSPFLHPPPRPCSEGITSMTVAKKRAFFDDRWTQNRIVTSMDWSGHVSRVLVSLDCLPGILSL